MVEQIAYFGAFDTKGRPVAFFNTDIFPDTVTLGERPEPTEAEPSPTRPEISRTRNVAIPAEAVQITDEQWLDLLAHPEERRWNGSRIEILEPPALPTPPLPAISDRQFGEGLWRERLISFDEYLAFVGPGAVPPPLLAIINTLPDDDTDNPTPRKVALGLVTGAQSYVFDDPLVDVIRQAQGWTVEHLRERWASWAAL